MLAKSVEETIAALPLTVILAHVPQFLGKAENRTIDELQ